MFQIVFYCDDKNLGEAFKRLAGIARNVQHIYMPNLEAKANGQVRASASETQELIAKEITKRGWKEFKGPDLKDVLSKLGMPTSSYSYFAQQLVKAGFLKKGKLVGNVMNYTIVGK
jgi:hypothetical protein